MESKDEERKIRNQKLMLLKKRSHVSCVPGLVKSDNNLYQINFNSVQISSQTSNTALPNPRDVLKHYKSDLVGKC